MASVGSVGGSPRPEESGQSVGNQSSTTGESAAGEARSPGNAGGLQDLIERAKRAALAKPGVETETTGLVRLSMDGGTAPNARVSIRLTALPPDAKRRPTLEGPAMPGEDQAGAALPDAERRPTLEGRAMPGEQ